MFEKLLSNERFQNVVIMFVRSAVGARPTMKPRAQKKVGEKKSPGVTLTIKKTGNRFRDSKRGTISIPFPFRSVPNDQPDNENASRGVHRHVSLGKPRRRLRLEGWNVWHSTCRDACGRTHIVHIHRPGAEWQGFGPTLTDAFVEARGPPCRGTEPCRFEPLTFEQSIRSNRRGFVIRSACFDPPVPKRSARGRPLAHSFARRTSLRLTADLNPSRLVGVLILYRRTSSPSASSSLISEPRRTGRAAEFGVMIRNPLLNPCILNFWFLNPLFSCLFRNLRDLRGELSRSQCPSAEQNAAKIAATFITWTNTLGRLSGTAGDIGTCGGETASFRTDRPGRMASPILLRRAKTRGAC